MSDVTELQRSIMQTLLDTHGDDEIAVCDAYAEAERAGKVARPEEDRGEFAESYARSLWRIGQSRRLACIGSLSWAPDLVASVIGMATRGRIGRLSYVASSSAPTSSGL